MDILRHLHNMNFCRWRKVLQQLWMDCQFWNYFSFRMVIFFNRICGEKVVNILLTLSPFPTPSHLIDNPYTKDDFFYSNLHICPKSSKICYKLCFKKRVMSLWKSWTHQNWPSFRAKVRGKKFFRKQFGNYSFWVKIILMYPSRNIFMQCFAGGFETTLIKITNKKNLSRSFD